MKIQKLKIRPQLNTARMDRFGSFAFSAKIGKIGIQIFRDPFLKKQTPCKIGAGLQAFQHLVGHWRKWTALKLIGDIIEFPIYRNFFGIGICERKT